VNRRGYRVLRDSSEAEDLLQDIFLLLYRKCGTFDSSRGSARSWISLGIFYEDNVGKKRWVLKLDDAKTLAQIDAVFVTVEPSGGSQKPSGQLVACTSTKHPPPKTLGASLRLIIPRPF
jgi:hypothetical protein